MRALVYIVIGILLFPETPIIAGISPKVVFPACGVYRVEGRLHCDPSQQFCDLKMNQSTLSEYKLSLAPHPALRSAEGLKVAVSARIRSVHGNVIRGALDHSKIELLQLEQPIGRPRLLKEIPCQ